MQKPVKIENGKAVWAACEGDSYLITGTDLRGKRFKREGSWFTVSCINAYRGTRWLVRAGKRYKIQTVTN